MKGAAKTVAVLLLLLISFVARAVTPVDPLRRDLGGVTIEVVGHEVMARNSTQILWRHPEPVEFNFSGLEVTEQHVVVTGNVHGWEDRPQVVVLTLQGQVVYRTFGRWVALEGEHFYFQDASASKNPLAPTGFQNIHLIHFHSATKKQRFWMVEAKGIPEECKDLQKPTAPYFVERVKGNWRFLYQTSKCDILVGFQEEKRELEVLEVKNTRKTIASLHFFPSPLPLFTYPVLLLPLWTMRHRRGWSIGITFGMVVLTRATVSLHLFFPLTLLLWAVMTLLVLGWRKMKKQPINLGLLGASLSVLITFGSLALQAEARCWSAWWC